MSPSMNRRTLLKESLAATAAGAWRGTRPQTTSLPRTGPRNPPRERHHRPGQCLADGPDRQAEGKPDVVGRQSADPLYAQPRPAVRVQPGCPLQHRREDHGDLGGGGAARHQHALHKTFHHHEYPTAPKPEQLKGPTAEAPGYWCKDPQGTIDLMKTVEKPWIAFKVMAAGAIPPKDAFRYAFNNGADHILVGMFDFEIAEDVEIAKAAIAAATRTRPWRSVGTVTTTDEPPA